jgi:hypothetical protein
MVRLAETRPITQPTDPSGAQRGLKHSPAETLSPRFHIGAIAGSALAKNRSGSRARPRRRTNRVRTLPDLLALLTFSALLTFVFPLSFLLSSACLRPLVDRSLSVHPVACTSPALHLRYSAFLPADNRPYPHHGTHPTFFDTNNNLSGRVLILEIPKSIWS